MLNREQWLTELAKQIEVLPFFRDFSLGKYRITCGWPCSGGTRVSRTVLGECHNSKTSKDGTYEIFISPTRDNPLEVAGITCHEMAHVIAGTEAKHGSKFVTICRHVGITRGKPTSAMPGGLLNENLQKIIDIQGAYPHSAITPVLRRVAKSKTQVKLSCSDCGCTVIISNKWLESAGPTTCGCGSLMEVLNAEDNG